MAEKEKKGSSKKQVRSKNKEEKLDQAYKKLIQKEIVQDKKRTRNNLERKKVTSTEVDENIHLRGIHFSFEARVLLLVSGILVLFIWSSYLMISTLQKNEAHHIPYVENSTVHYHVCSGNSEFFESNCMEENQTYSLSDVSTVPVDFHYDITFGEEFDSNFSYYVVALHDIYNLNDSSKAVYEDEDMLVERGSLKRDNNVASVDVHVDIDYQKYQNFVNEYSTKYSMDTNSIVQVTLYITDGNEARDVTGIEIPIGVESFQITRNGIEDFDHVYLLEITEWSNRDTLYIVSGSFLILLSLILLFRLTNLALLVTGRKTKYQQMLGHILTEYDDLIVVAKDTYEVHTNKRIVKTTNFKELLDARNIVNKPIIYSKINNIKCEFIVEDEDVIYKYILKEADIDE